MEKTFEEGDIKIVIDNEKCTGVGECVTVCPVEIFSVENGKAVCTNIGECIECCACVSAGPNDAIVHSSC